MTAPTPDSIDPCLAGGGDAGALMRSIDWAKTPIGPVSVWPQTLRVAVAMMLSSRFAMRILWGPELIMLHNDAYRPILGTSKYPHAMGKRTQDYFGEVWDVVGPLFDRVMQGEAIALEDRSLPLERHDYLGEAFFTLSYSPLGDDRGGVGGVLGVVSETTERVVAERRLRALRDLAAAVSPASSASAACEAAARSLAGAGEDVPFAALYLRRDADEATLAAHVGLDDAPAARPPRLDRDLLPTAGQRWAIVDARARFGALRAGPHLEPLQSVIVLPLRRAGTAEPIGYLVAGVSPRRALDTEYETFFELAGDHVSAALANAIVLAHAEAERSRLRSFLLEAPAAIAVLRGRDLRFELANESFCLLIGRKRDDLLGLRIRDALPEIAAQRIVDLLEGLYASGDTFRAREFPAELDRGGDGVLTPGWFDWSARATHDAYGVIDGLMIFAVDVTDQIVSRRAAESSRAFLEAVVDQMPAGVVIAEAPSGKTLLSSERVRALRGQEIRTDSIDQFARYAAMNPDGSPIEPSRFPIVRAISGELVPEQEVLVDHPDGARRTLLVTASPVRDAEQRVVAAVSSFVDITARKRTEVALRESEETGRAILAALEEGIVVRNIDATVRFANASAERILGMSFDEIAGRPLGPAWNIIQEDGSPFPADALSTAIVFRSGAPVSTQIMGVLRPDGRLVWLSLNAQPLFDAEGEVSGVVSSFYDITERRNVERDRQTLLARAESARIAAEEASRTKDEFLAVVSHELRNPLNAMLGWTRLLRGGSLPAERAARALETIERNATSQAVLIEDLLDISRIVSGKLPLDVQTVNFARVIEAAIDSARPAIEAKGLKLKVVLENEGVLSGDADRLQQVVWNLLTNATKFTPKEGSIFVELRRDESHLELSVTDSGQGVEPAFLAHVFDRFKQADSTSTRQHGGLGLGLAIAKNLVEMHGGTIAAQSDGPGTGATFVVRLPVAALRRSPVPAAAPRAPSDPMVLDVPPELRDIRVLVVDDEPDAREIVMSVLVTCGVRVRTASSAASALRAIEEEVPDVLLSDIGMPGEDGYSLVAKVRALARESGGAMPAACLSGYTTVDDRRRALMAGFNMHLAKPIEPAELVAVVANLGRMAKALRGS